MITHRRQVARRWESDHEYKRGWYGQDLPNIDYDDGFSAGLRSANSSNTRLFAFFIVLMIVGMVLVFIIAWTGHP